MPVRVSCVACRLDLVLKGKACLLGNIAMCQQQHEQFTTQLPELLVPTLLCIQSTMSQKVGGLATWLVACQLGGSRRSLLKVGQVRIGSLEERDDCIPSTPPLASLLIQAFSHLHS